MNLRPVLKSQYHAAMTMLREAIERCPDDLWTDLRYTNKFWHVVYHALFFTHLYLERDEKSFTPWEHARKDYHFLGPLPWPPHHHADITEAYTKPQLLDYWSLCDDMVDDAVDALDLEAPDCGFWWYKMCKLEHQINNIRHLQHHTGQLADRARAAASVGVEWACFRPHSS